MKYAFIISCFLLILASSTVRSQSIGNPDPTGTINVGSTTTNISMPWNYNLYSNTPPSLYNFKRSYRMLQPEKNIAQVTVTSPVATSVKSIEYTDGWGRVIQKIDYHSSMLNDLVTCYDHRPVTANYTFLPYPVNLPGTSYSKFQMSPFTDQRNTYNALYPNEQGAAVGKTEYTSDNDKRIVTVYAPGRSNIGFNKGTTTGVFLNASNEVILFNEPENGEKPIKTGFYAAGALIKKVSTNADGAWVAEFFDKEDKLICKKQLTGTTKIDLMEQDGTQTPIAHYSDRYAWTYCVYDGFGRLRYTISPKAIALFMAGTNNVIDGNIKEELCNYAEYDNFGRVILQHNAGEVGNHYFVYDKHDRVAMNQSPQLADEGKWVFNCYDEQDRVRMSGIANSGNDRAHWQSQMDNPPSLTTSNFLYYLVNEGTLDPNMNNSSSNTLSQGEFLAYYDYDNYRATLPTAINEDNTGLTKFSGLASYIGAEFTNNTVSTPSSVTPVLSVRTKGLLTATKVKVLNPSNPAPIADVNKWIRTFHHYDDFGREIQSATDNHSFGTDIVSTQYNFNGNPLRKIINHENPKSTKPVNPKRTLIVKDFQYHSYYPDKLRNIREQIDGSTFRVVANYSYNDFGQVKSKDIGDVELQQYEYNLRGQLTAINRDHVTNLGSVKKFGEIISYDREFHDIYYNGKIAGMIWREEGNSIQKSYTYNYDLAGRMVNGEYLEKYVPAVMTSNNSYQTWNNAAANYTEGNISYDANGNILSLQRYGAVATKPGLMDDLQYTYKLDGNTLESVTDLLNHATPVGYEFSNGGAGGHNYDKNGNLLTDDNKGPVSNKGLTIEYDAYLNKPIKMIQGGLEIRYVYDARGNKLVEQHTGTTTDRYDYIGPVLYHNFDLAQVNSEEGYTTYNGNQFDQELYFVRDHLSNVRQVLKKVPAGYTTPPNDGSWRADIGFEPGDAVAEEAVAVLIGRLRDFKPLSVDPGDQYAATLDAAVDDRRLGSVMIFNLMAGDRVKLGADCYYETTQEEGISITAEDMMNNIIGTLTGEGGITGGEASAQQLVEKMFSSDNYLNVFQSIKAAQTDYTRPLSYLNYVFFDENLNIIPSQSGAIQIAAADGDWRSVALGGTFDDGMLVQQGGTMIVYIDHQGGGTGLTKAYWDNVTSEVYYGELKEKFHYYPFGNVTTTSSNYQQLKRQLYQTKEYSKELSLYDFHARQYDPLIGRFTSVDPKYQHNSPYIGMGNDPVTQIDPDGMTNMIYMVNLPNSGFNWMTLGIIASMTQSYFASYGININIAPFPGLETVDLKYLDKTDALMVFGSGNDAISYIRNVSQDIGKTMYFENNSPEVTRHSIGAFDTDVLSEFSKNVGEDLLTTSVYTMSHSVGHVSYNKWWSQTDGLRRDEYGHSKSHDALMRWDTPEIMGTMTGLTFQAKDGRFKTNTKNPHLNNFSDIMNNDMLDGVPRNQNFFELVRNYFNASQPADNYLFNYYISRFR